MAEQIEWPHPWSCVADDYFTEGYLDITREISGEYNKIVLIRGFELDISPGVPIYGMLVMVEGNVRIHPLTGGEIISVQNDNIDLVRPSDAVIASANTGNLFDEFKDWPDADPENPLLSWIENHRGSFEEEEPDDCVPELAPYPAEKSDVESLWGATGAKKTKKKGARNGKRKPS